MANAVIDVYDQELSPTVQSLLDVGSSRAAFVDNDILWVCSSAIADGSTYRFELRQLGAIGSYSITSLPNPNIVAAFQLNDANGYIGAIAKTSEGDILFRLRLLVRQIQKFIAGQELLFLPMMPHQPAWLRPH